MPELLVLNDWAFGRMRRPSLGGHTQRGCEEVASRADAVPMMPAVSSGEPTSLPEVPSVSSESVSSEPSGTSVKVHGNPSTSSPLL